MEEHLVQTGTVGRKTQKILMVFLRLQISSKFELVILKTNRFVKNLLLPV